MTEPELDALLENLHTTTMGEERIRRNAAPTEADVIAWCKERITAPDAVIERRGKNFYITSGGCTLTVNVGSYTVITAHKAVISSGIKNHEIQPSP